MNRLLIPLLFASALGTATLVACDGGVGTPDCVDDGNCDEGQACIEGSCEDVECLTNEDCGIETVCADNVCKPGCDTNDDCLSGYECDTTAHLCVEQACRTTELDCSVGQSCDTTTGDCNDVGGLCNQCQITDWYTGADNCPGQSTCLILEDPGKNCTSNGDCPSGTICGENLTSQDLCLSDNDCPTGRCKDFLCIAKQCMATYCFGTCQGDEDCASGFSCFNLGQGQNYCVGDCLYYKEEGYL